MEYRLRDRPGRVSIWVKFTMTNEILTIVDELGASAYQYVNVIFFNTVEDITIFRLKANV